MKRSQDETKQDGNLGHEEPVSLNDAIHSLRTGIYVADNDGTISYANRSFAEMFRYEHEGDLVGVNLANQFYVEKKDREAFLKQLHEKGYVSDYQIKMVRRDGSHIVIVAHSNILKNKKGKVVGVEGILKELPDRQKASAESEAQLPEMVRPDADACRELDRVITDPLTGLYNYQYFLKCLDAEIKRSDRFARPLCFLMADIDNFHSVNNQFGRDRGDAVIQKVGELLRQHLRPTDILCRQAQDQFLAILPEATKDEALALAKTVKDNIQSGTAEISLTCSMGLSRYIPGMTVQELLLKANLGLYMAKEMGKNEACLYG